MRRVYTGMNVFDAAVDRMVAVYEEGHTVVVSMSGGKDSGVCLEVSLEAARRTGNLPVKTVFREEEILYPGTHEYLERVRAREEVELHWLCAHQPGVNVFNRRNPMWWVNDPLLPSSEHVRPLPDYAEVIEQKVIEAIVHPSRFPVREGKHLVDVVGLRISESAKRLLGLVSSGGYMTGTNMIDRVPYARARPVYDWTDRDVWTAIHKFGWDYNRAYDVMHRMGVPSGGLRIGPPTLTVAGAQALKMASSAWPKWFDRVCRRLEGVRQAAQFGATVCKPRRRRGETWKQCFYRTCIDGAPADWIRDRAIKAEKLLVAKHVRHSSEPFPDVKVCHSCNAAGLASYMKLAHACFNGDPFSLKLQAISSTHFPFMEPEFFREGAGTWGKGKPTW